MMQREASFLGIPREIRQYVYDYLMRCDLNYEVVKAYKDGWGAGGFGTVMCRHPSASLAVPWVNLLLACKAINAELSSYMSSPVVLGNEDNRTYTMDIIASGRGYLNSATWHKIPCSSNNADRVVVNIFFEFKSSNGRSQATRRRRQVRTWGDGGPMPILRQLYQTLNLMLHNGPMLNRSSPLRKPLKLKKLEIHTAFMPDSIDSDEPRTEHLVARIKPLLERLLVVGLLHGYIDQVYIDDEYGHTEFTMMSVDGAAVPTFWDRYGFEWGLDHDNPVKWEMIDEEESTANPTKS
ncbi:hypothetical protein F5Y08DRAFT_290330 [Xylaria arbuscula]|nr:hypothetical protein F5Y08DRAFT_290330 [Xylaria arbuscula]